MTAKHLLRVTALLALIVVAATPAAAQTLGRSTISSASSTCTETATACVRVGLSSVPSVGVQVVGAGTYTLQIEMSADGGTTWVQPGAVDVSDYSRDTSISAPGVWLIANAGFTHLRVRASAYTSGTPVVSVTRGFGGVNAPLSAGSISGANDAAGTVGSSVPSAGSYSAINVGGTLRGWTGLNLGSQYAAGVAILDGSGNQIASFGGGTQYATGAAEASPTGTTALGHDGSNVRALSVNASGQLQVVFPSAQAVSGTVTANLSATDNAVLDDIADGIPVTNAGTFAVQAAQSGTWTVQPGNTANTTAWLVTGTGGTFPATQSGTWNITNVSGTISLPTGASTAANQSTIAGHVDGIETLLGTTNTSLGLLDNAVGTVAAGTAATASLLAGGVYNSTPITLTNTQGAALQVDANGYVKVNVAAGSSAGPSDTDDGSIAGGQSVGIVQAQMNYWTGSAWARVTGPTDATHGDPALTTGPIVQGHASSTAPTAVDANDAAKLWVSLNGAANVILRGTDGTSAWGTAGSAATPVLSVQGTASGTALPVSGTVTATADPCFSMAKTHLPFNISTATTTEITPSLAGASNYYYVCSIDIVTGGANNVALVDDDSDGCGSVTSGMAGGTAAANGWNFAANGGMAKGNGLGTVFRTGGTNRVVCLVTSAAVQLSGSIQVVAAP